MHFSKKIGYYIFLVILTGFILEGVSYIVERKMVWKGIVYQPPIPTDYEDYLSKRNPVVGWPEIDSFNTGERDSSGSRNIPSSPDVNQESCVSLYGDSFTWGAEVSDEDAWSNVLSQMLNCRVSNFGVVGYGTDQSYLRFKQNQHDGANIVILGHLSENIVRNVNQFHALLYGSKRAIYGLKPRFVIDGNGNLKHVPLLHLSGDEYRDMVEHPEKFLKYEYLLPGGPAGVRRSGFPYTVSVLSTFNNYRVRAKLAGKIFWADFYRDDHPSQALQITALIMKTFCKEASLKGKIPVVVIFPWVLDLHAFQKDNTWTYQTLLNDLSKNNIDVLNIGTGVIENLGQRKPETLYTTFHGGHFNKEGNRLVAQLIADYLIQKGFIKQKGDLSHNGNTL